MNRPAARTAGLTLIELLVALALMSMLLVALLTFVFSLSGIWGRSSDQRLFNQHVDAVTRHLESMLRRAALPAGGTVQSEPYSWQEIHSASDGTFTALGFTLVEGDRLLAWNGTPAPLTVCALNVAPQRGLVLYWQSLLEEDADTWHDQTVSPLLTGLSFNYFNPDAGTWRSETTPEKTARGAAIVPDQIVLHFTYAKLKADRVLTLPVVPNGIPTF
ncbi:MAG: type II secretion system protein J [Opitutales bacterium]